MTRTSWYTWVVQDSMVHLLGDYLVELTDELEAGEHIVQG